MCVCVCVCVFVHRLYTLDGEVVTQVQDGGKYVAVEGGKPFRRVAYCATSTITALRRKRLINTHTHTHTHTPLTHILFRNATLTLPVVTRRWQKAQAGRAHPSFPLPSLSNTMPAVRPQPPPVVMQMKNPVDSKKEHTVLSDMIHYGQKLPQPMNTNPQ